MKERVKGGLSAFVISTKISCSGPLLHKIKSISVSSSSSCEFSSSAHRVLFLVFSCPESLHISAC